MPKTKAKISLKSNKKIREYTPKEEIEKIIDPDLLLEDDALPIIEEIEEEEEDEEIMDEEEVNPFKDKWEE